MTIAFIILGVLLVSLLVIRGLNLSYSKKSYISMVILSVMADACVFGAYKTMSNSRLFFSWILGSLIFVIIGFNILVSLIKYQKLQENEEATETCDQTVDK